MSEKSAMKIEDVLLVAADPPRSHYRIVRAIVKTPDMEKAGWLPDSEYALWTVAVEHSDGQYGGGTISATGKTMEAALVAAVAAFKATMAKVEGVH